MVTFNNCDELLDFLHNNYANPVCEEAIFQGDKVRLSGYNPRDLDFVCFSPKYNRTIFFISKPSVYKTLVLTILIGSGRPDELYGIELPSYVKDELINTALGLY